MKALRHTKTGELYPMHEHLAKHPDVESVNLDKEGKVIEPEEVGPAAELPGAPSAIAQGTEEPPAQAGDNAQGTEEPPAQAGDNAQAELASGPARAEDTVDAQVKEEAPAQASRSRKKVVEGK